ncbi:hypothetical protein ALI22I_20290 [Saccharothrix sp. ALI-22-I]|nr:hypothetical protein ALI22I_20290 [Saccharothrix sp. ALI-22-I]
MGLGPTDMSAEFQPGDRVRFVSTTDPELYSLLRPGALGTVAVTDDIGTIHINWDDGSCLGMILHDGTDVIERTD